MNRLASARSPYLRQHQDNPVDWYLWGDDAFEAARRLDRPLFVSIGYSACHWCHVMAHESFEDDATAAALNASFVAVKVDREEQPDVDAVYLEAVQALTGSGGWPLSVFLTPDGRPFFGGTYFPKTARYGSPAFTSVLEAVATAWREQRAGIVEQAAELTAAVGERLGPPPATALPGVEDANDAAFARFASIYDSEHGGAGRAPKFPQPPMLELVLRAHLDGRPGALEMVTTTLGAMASGGIYDQLGGGFARYSVDRSWSVPHFEKMLYDQAGLARLYLHTWQVTGDPRWRQIATETLDYVLRDLALPAGGLASAEDADSEGEEGRFYVWRRPELDEVLGAERGAIAAAHYGVTAEGNFEDERTVLHRPERGDLLRSPEIEALRAELFAARERRVRPGLDDKVLTEWNAMAIATLAEVAGATGEARFGAAALELGEFLLAHLRRPDGRWLRSYQGGEAAHLAVAGDHAWLVEAFTRLYEYSGDLTWLAAATDVAEALIERFGAEDGGFYTTGSDATPLVVRPRDLYDGVVPAAGSVAAWAFVRLAALTGVEHFAARASACVAAAGAALAQGPLSVAHLLGAATMLERGSLEIVVTGERPDLLDVARRAFVPDGVLAFGAPDAGPLLAGRAGGLGYVCLRGECKAPAVDVAAFEAALAEASSGPGRAS